MNGNQLHVEYISIEDLKHYERNTRTHSEEQIAQLCRSIEEYGFTNPVLIDENNELIAGHGRSTAAAKLGMKEVPAIRLTGLTDAKKRALRIADNQLALNAGWDEEMLRIEIVELQDEDFDLDLLGFSDDALNALLEPDDVADDDEEPSAADGDVGEPPAEPITEPGDVWTLGRHRLVCGDSTKPETFELLMQGEKADMTITSPPYGAGSSAKLRNHYVRGQENLKSFYDEHEDDKSEWAGLMRDFFAQCQTHSQCQFVNVQMLADNKRDLLDWLNANADRFVDCIIWDKGFGAPQMHDNVLNNAFEFIFVFDNENGTRSIPFADFHGKYSNVLRVSRGHNEYSDIHKAVYPVELPLAILDITANAKSVLDPFGGTGTTMIACEQTNRRCFMVEKSANYCDVIINRWQSMTGGKAVRADGVKFDDLVAERKGAA